MFYVMSDYGFERKFDTAEEAFDYIQSIGGEDDMWVSADEEALERGEISIEEIEMYQACLDY